MRHPQSEVHVWAVAMEQDSLIAIPYSGPRIVGIDFAVSGEQVCYL